MVFQGTASHRGRQISVSPANSLLERLWYGRILLGPTAERQLLDRGARDLADRHARRVCAHGRRRPTIWCCATALTFRAEKVEVSATVDTDIVETAPRWTANTRCRSSATSDVCANPKLKFTAGGAATSRDLNIVIGDNVKAGRLMVGFTRSQPGHWTSWPPHEHTTLAEELYVYFDMPPPASAFSWSTPAPRRPSWRRSCARGTRC